MDISGVSIPTTPPDVYQEPPRDAELASAVQEGSQAEPQTNNGSASQGSSQDSGPQPRNDEGPGQFVNEKV